MKKFLNILKNFIIIVYVVLIIFVTVCLISYNDYQVSVIGDSTLIPVIDEDLKDYTLGDLLIVKRKNPSKVIKDEKVFFYMKRFGEPTINYSTVVDVQQVTPTEITFTVEGDYKFSSGNYIGRVDDVIIIPKVGKILNILESKWGFLFLGVFPTLLAFLYTLHSVVTELIENGDKKSKKKKKKKKVEETENDKEDTLAETEKENESKEIDDEVEEIEEKLDEIIKKETNSVSSQIEEKEEKPDNKETIVEENKQEETKEDTLKQEESEIASESKESEEENKEEDNSEIKDEPLETIEKHEEVKPVEEPKKGTVEISQEEKRRAAIEAKVKSMTEEEKRALIKAKLDSMTEEEKRALIEEKKKKLEAEKYKKGE